MVLFLFVVMMIDVSVETVKQGVAKYMPLGVLLGLVMVVEMGMVFVGKNSIFVDKYTSVAQVIPEDVSANYSNTHELGLFLYTNYLYAFEIVALILLVGMIAAISLTLRPKRAYTKYMPIPEQLSARKEDRLKIIKMESSKLETAPNPKEEKDSCNS